MIGESSKARARTSAVDADLGELDGLDLDIGHARSVGARRGLPWADA